MARRGFPYKGTFGATKSDIARGFLEVPDGEDEDSLLDYILYDTDVDQGDKNVGFLGERGKTWERL